METVKEDGVRGRGGLARWVHYLNAPLTRHARAEGGGGDEGKREVEVEVAREGV